MTDYFELRERDYWNSDLFAKGSLQNYYGNYTLKINAKDLGSPQNTVEEIIYITSNVINFINLRLQFTKKVTNYSK